MKNYRRQPSLFPEEKRFTEHGGEIRKGKRKTRRPIATKAPMHLVLKSTRAKGPLSLLQKKTARFLVSLLSILSAKYDVRIYSQANSGNHLHLVVCAKTRLGLQYFLKVLTSKIALEVTGAIKGRAFGKFWDYTAYSRIAS